MIASPHPPARHLACLGLFLAVVFAFFARYGLICFGVLESQVPKRKAGAAAPPAADAGRALPRFERFIRGKTAEIDEFAKQNALWRIPVSELNMAFRKLAGMRLFPDADNTLRLNNGYLIDPRPRVNIDYCAGQIAGFHRFCAERDVPFLYVLMPRKSARHDSQLPVGMEDHCVENADRLVETLTAGGVPVLDLRNHAQADFTNYFELFFRTDHHWKPEGGLWAAAQIAAELNRRHDWQLPVALLAPSNFDVRVYSNFFLGSLGKKLTRAYSPPEDFSLITPKFETDFAFDLPHRDLHREGSFRDTFINDRQIDSTNYYHRNPYAAYFWGDPPNAVASNRRLPGGRRLLVVKDSFADVVLPFLALVAERLDALDLRYYAGSAQDYVVQHRPDVVLVLYNAGNVAAAPRNPPGEDPFKFD